MSQPLIKFRFLTQSLLWRTPLRCWLMLASRVIRTARTPRLLTGLPVTRPGIRGLYIGHQYSDTFSNWHFKNMVSPPEMRKIGLQRSSLMVCLKYYTYMFLKLQCRPECWAERTLIFRKLRPPCLEWCESTSCHNFQKEKTQEDSFSKYCEYRFQN